MTVKIYSDVVQTEPVVTCAVCGKQCLVSSKDFIVVFGNVHHGMDDAVIGDNINDKGKLTGSTVICKEHEFVTELLKAFAPTQARTFEGGGEQ